MKAVFKGYKKAGYFDFTVGKIYDLSRTPGSNNEYVKVKDDKGYLGVINLSVYDFEFIEPTDFVVKGDNFKVEKAGIKYFINKDIVTKEAFYEVRREVRQLTLNGVKTSSIKFEVKFE